MGQTYAKAIAGRSRHDVQMDVIDLLTSSHAISEKEVDALAGKSLGLARSLAQCLSHLLTNAKHMCAEIEVEIG